MAWHRHLSFFPQLNSFSSIEVECKQQSRVHGFMAAQATSCRKFWHQLHGRRRMLTGHPSLFWHKSCQWRAKLSGRNHESSSDFSKAPQLWCPGHVLWTLAWYWRLTLHWQGSTLCSLMKLVTNRGWLWGLDPNIRSSSVKVTTMSQEAHWMGFSDISTTPLTLSTYIF